MPFCNVDIAILMQLLKDVKRKGRLVKLYITEYQYFIQYKYILYFIYLYIYYINYLVTYCKAKLQCPDSNLAHNAIFFQKFLNVVKCTIVLAILYVFDNKPFKPRFLK